MTGILKLELLAAQGLGERSAGAWHGTGTATDRRSKTIYATLCSEARSTAPTVAPRPAWLGAGLLDLGDRVGGTVDRYHPAA